MALALPSPQHPLVDKSGRIDPLWYQVISQLADSGRSFAAEGYAKFPNGFIIQWGTTGAATTGTETFSVPFPTACLSVTFGPATADRVTAATSISVTAFNWSTRVASTGAVATSLAYWIAIGH